MGYSLPQITEVLSKTDKTLYKIGAIAYENMFSELSEALDYERDTIFIYKEAVEWADDFYVGDIRTDAIVERLSLKISIYDYGNLNPIYSGALSITNTLPGNYYLYQLGDVYISNLQNNQVLTYSSILNKWINSGPNSAIRASQSFTATLNQTVFVTSSPFTAGLFDVYLNGVRLNSSSYSTFGEYTITLSDGCLADDIIDVTIYSPLTSVSTAYVPTARTLTINGITQDLAADRSWTISTGSTNTYSAGLQLIGTNVKQKLFTTIYQKSLFTSLSDFTATGFTPTIVNNCIQITGGASDFNQYISLNNNTNADENVDFEVIVKAITPGYGFSIGKKSVNTSYGLSINFRLSSLDGYILFEAGSIGAIPSLTTKTLPTISANDIIRVRYIQKAGKLTGIVENLTTGSYTFLTISANFGTSKNFSPANSSNYAIWNHSGTYQIMSMNVKSSMPYAPDVVCIGDSKTFGYASTSQNLRWTSLLNNLGNVVTYAGDGDKTADVLSSLNYIINFKPKYLILAIGRNDLAAGVSSATWQSNYQSIVNTLTAAGITVIHFFGMDETTQSQTALWIWINSTYTTNKIDIRTLWVNGTMLSADNIHPNEFGHRFISSQIIASGLIPLSSNYNPDYIDYIPKEPVDSSSFVTLGTTQTISGAKTFSNKVSISNTTNGGAPFANALSVNNTMTSASFTNIWGMDVNVGNSAASVAMTSVGYLQFQNTITLGAGGSIVYAYGLKMPLITQAVNNVHINIGGGGTLTGNWGIYNAAAGANYFAGKLSIGTATASASAILQADSTTQGFLPPRMTSAQRTAIGSAATGLVVYQTDGTEGLYEKTAAAWRIVNASAGGAGSGTVTSIGLSMPSAFTVASSPITTAGTISVTGNGSTLQYIDGTGALQTFPVRLESDSLVAIVRNQSGATMIKGTIVYISGATGNKPLVSKALATGDATSAQTFGLLQTDIANNADGHMVVIGNITDIDTSALTEGQQLYLSGTTAGTWTTTKPYAPIHLVYVGVVLRSHVNFGIIAVKIQNGYELDELHDVQVGSYVNKDIIYRDTTANLWKNASIATILGYTPANGNIYTSSGILSGNRSITLSGSYLDIIGSVSTTRFQTTGNVTIGSVSDTGLAKLQVTGSIQQTAVFSNGGGQAMLKADASGILVLAVAGTDFVRTEVDPIYTASSWYTTTNNYANWNTAFSWGNHASYGYLTTATAATTYQPLDGDLTSIAGLVGTTGFLKKTAVNTWALDTTLPANWDSAYTHSTTTTGSIHGSTTVGGNFLRLTNPSAITFVRINADNSVSTLDDATFRTAIGAGTSSTTGTVTSVGLSVPTGLNVGSSPVTTTGTIALTFTAGYSIPTTASQTNWDTAFTDRNKWDGGVTGLVAATGRTSLGLVIGTDVLAFRTFGTAANNNTGDFALTASANTLSGIQTISNITQSTSNSNGALIVSGGVGIAKNTFIGGNLTIDGNFTVGGTTTTVNATNLSVADNMIYLNNGSEATITNVVGNGTTITYTANNNYTAGMSVTITGTNIAGYNLTNATIATVSATQFTVTNAATGTYTSGGLARAKSSANPDLGFAGGYYIASYAHAGLFRDASDSGTWKFFQGYTPEPDASPFIDTADASFALAPLQASTITSASFVRVGGLVTEFLKANGTVDSTTYVSSTRTISTTTPLTGGGDLSANRTIAIPAATTSVSGYLTSTDWTTFNGKISANQTITFTPTGDVTGTASGATTLNPALTIGAAAVTYAKIQNVSANTFLANVTGTAATVQEIATTKIPLFTSAITGTASGTTFLRGDGAWATPAGGGGITWSEITATTATAAINNGYIANNASLVTITLPPTAAVGSVVEVTGKLGGWKIVYGTGDIIHFGNLDTTVTTGYLQSTLVRDSISLVCVVADTEWNVVSSIGNITIV